jgi:hypothetical protein
VEETKVERAALAARIPPSSVLCDRWFLKSTPGDPLVRNQPMGENKVGGHLAALCKRAGVTNKYTGHSLRATYIARATMAGVRDEDIITITGHRSVEALNMYKRPTPAYTESVQVAIQGALVGRGNQQQMTSSGTLQFASHSAEIAPTDPTQNTIDDSLIGPPADPVLINTSTRMTKEIRTLEIKEKITRNLASMVKSIMES